MAGRRTQWKPEKPFPFPARGSQFLRLEKPGCHPESTPGGCPRSHTGSKWRVGEPLPFPLLPCISLTAEDSQQVKQALIPEQKFNHGLCPAFSGFVIEVRALFDYESQHSSTTHTLHNILSHSAVIWHSSVPVEIKPKCICVTGYICFSGTGWC